MTQIGFGQRIITPPIGAEMPGGFQKRRATHVHDDLLVCAMVLHDGEESVAVVGVDALSLKRSTVLAARSRIAESTRIPGENVMIAASHTHTGGPTCEVFLSEADPAYCTRVADACAEAVEEAWSRREEARLVIGSGRLDGVAFNRRFRMRDGCEQTHPGKGNPDIMEAAGPTDPEVGVIAAMAAADDRFMGCLVNYTCHCTVGVGGDGFSADYPYYLRRTVAGAMGNAAAVIVFTNGACGDVTQVDNLHEGPREFGAAWGRFVGCSLAGEVIKVLARIERVSDVTVSSRRKLASLTPRSIAAGELMRARETLERRTPEAAWTRDEIMARELVLLEEMIREEPVVNAEVQVISVGPATLVSNPAELFCRFGHALKKASPSPYTWVVELANGCIGYVPGFEQVVRQEGYEPQTARSSKLSPNAGDELVSTAVALLEQL